MGLARLLVGTLACLCCAGLSKSAFAQDQSPTITLASAGITYSAPHGMRLLASQINAADCRNDATLRFPLTLSYSRGYALEIWAGSACDNALLRTSPNSVCWQVGSSIAASDGADAVEARVRSVLYGRTQASDSTITPGGEPPGLDSAAACEDAAGISVPQALNVYFMLVDSAERAVAVTTWAATYKLVSPHPPDTLFPAIGQEQLLLEFTHGLADTTINGYELYCDPAPGVSHDGAAGATDPGSCRPSSVLVAGTDANLVSAQHCGSASKSASTASVGPLIAGVAYNVALTAVDYYENESVLSPVVCQVPGVKTDAEAQRSEKSTACAFSRRRQTLPLLVVLSVAGLLLGRRQRRRTREPLGHRM